MKKTIVREYQLPSSCIKGKQELTIAFLTDLHDQVTGEDGEMGNVGTQIIYAERHGIRQI